MNLTNLTSVSIVAVSILGTVIVVFFILLIVHVKRSGGKASGSVSDGKRSVSFTLENDNSDGTKSKRKNKKNYRSSSMTKNQTIEFLKSELLKTHKFFTLTTNGYTRTFHEFSIYSKLCAKHVKNESQEVINFKKLIAGKYLHECLFKYFCNSLTEWIENMKRDCEDKLDSDDEDLDDFIPVSYYSCLESFLNYKEETTKLAKSINFEFMDKMVKGIPDKFIEALNDWSMKNINVVSSSLNVVIYSTTASDWFNHVKEILDIYDIVFALILNDIDATLIILNGEMKKHVEDLLGRPVSSITDEFDPIKEEDSWR